MNEPLRKIAPATIGFDFDGVIADIGEAFIRLACSDHGYCSLKLEDIKSFQVEHCLDIDGESIEQIFDDILNDSIQTGLRPIPGAIETLTRISAISEVTIITARPELQPVREWLKFYCPPDTEQNITLIATGDHDDKERYIRQCNLSYFVDDRLRTCTQLAESGLSPLVYAQPWNINQHDLPSVADWNEISGLINFSGPMR